MNRVELSTQVKPSSGLFGSDPPLDMQINNLLVEIAENSSRVECTDGLAELSSQYELATAFRQRYLLLQAEVQRAREQVAQNRLPF
jgi:hypothetical protein